MKLILRAFAWLFKLLDPDEYMGLAFFLTLMLGMILLIHKIENIWLMAASELGFIVLMAALYFASTAFFDRNARANHANNNSRKDS